MKVSVIILPFRKLQLIPSVFDAIFAQTHKDLEVIAVLNDPKDGSRELIEKKYPQVKFVVPGWNAFFAIGNNIAIKQSAGEFIQLVNDDLILVPDYIEKLLLVFTDPKVAAATGKLLRYDFATHTKTNIIDSTGIVMSSSGRARDRGQLEADRGQYDRDREVFGVSGAAPMYRRSALETVKFQNEYFDESFFAYWEDVDLSWRLNRAGFKNVYVPEAIGYHGRTAGQSQGGYLHFWHYIKHHRQLPEHIRKFNYKNHILMYIKNATFIHPAFIAREVVMFGFILVFETSTLKVLPELFRSIPQILKKRRQQN